MGQPGVTPAPPPATEGRLESWKEIAAYLKRSVRTVQQWEKKEGLPVHRHLHDTLGTVYAYRAELDVWWRNGHARLEAKEAEQTEEVKEKSRRWMVAGAVAALVVAAGVGYLAWRRSTVPAASSTGKIMLAVLPFENLSQDPEQEYFSDGLTEEMITQLGRL
ncbi:MAG TPA: hypothetical protein VIG89_02165, partial [Candidatus Acidoferrales bacterium]